MPAPLQDVQSHLRGVGELQEEDLVARDVADGRGVVAAGQDVEAVEAHPESGVVGGGDDAPRVPVVVHVPAPGERFVGHAHAVLGGEVGERRELRCGEVVVVHRVGADVGADEQGRRPELLHDGELVRRAAQVARELLLGHRLEVAEGLVEVDGEPEVLGPQPDLARRPRAADEVVLEDLDAVEAGPGDRRELLVQGAAERDGRDRPTHARPPRPAPAGRRARAGPSRTSRRSARARRAPGRRTNGRGRRGRRPARCR